jgi:type II secretory pathway pseudopilin PulG
MRDEPFVYLPLTFLGYTMNRTQPRHNGFALIELVVVALVAVLAAALFWMQRGQLQKAHLQEASVNVSAALNRGRSLSHLSSTSRPVSWTAVSVTVDGVVTPLPYGVTITTPPAAGVAFRAPYGELVLPAELEENGLALESLAPGGQRQAVALVGVLGQVVRGPVTP